MALLVHNMGGGGDGTSDPYPISIEVTSAPTKSEYRPGDTLDLTGMVVKAVFTDGSKQVITSQCTMVPADGATLDKTDDTVVISWVWPTLGNTYTVEQPITMMVASGIRIKAGPTKTAYTAGETFSTAGMVIVADYPDGEKDITDEATITPADGTKIYESTTQVTAAWTDPNTGDELTVSKDITVTRVLSSITVSAPTKKEYKDGETLNLAGSAVTAHYNSGATENVTSKSTFNPTNGTTLTGSGTVTITASYSEGGVTKTGTTSVTVRPALEIVTFTNGTDAQIAAMIEADYAGTINLSDYWTVGDTRKITLTTNEQIEIAIAGFKHDDLVTSVSGKSKAAVTFTMTHSLATLAQMNSSNTNSGGWDSSAMRTRMSTYLSQLPQTWQNIIKTVKKKASAGNQSSTIKTSNDKLFLFSEIEVFGSTSYSYSGEGTQYEYYKTSAHRIKKQGISGSNKWWWERSPCASGAGSFCGVSGSGGASGSGAGNSDGVCFGFCA